MHVVLTVQQVLLLFSTYGVPSSITFSLPFPLQSSLITFFSTPVVWFALLSVYIFPCSFFLLFFCFFLFFYGLIFVHRCVIVPGTLTFDLLFDLMKRDHLGSLCVTVFCIRICIFLGRLGTDSGCTDGVGLKERLDENTTYMHT